MKAFPFNHSLIGLCLALLCAEPKIGRASTLTVTNTADSGAGTLRAAIASAANGDIINFSVTTPVTITLTTGELVISNSVSILGPGPSSLAINGNHTSRVFHIGPSNTDILAGLTVLNGFVTGSGTSGSGGGIRNDSSTLTVSNCIVTGNSAQFGGGIYTTGPLTITASTLSENSAGVTGGGIDNGSTLTVSNCTLSGNSTGLLGGGIRNDGSAIVTASTLSDNSVSPSTSGASGGAIYNFFGTVEIATSTLNGNSAGTGGGIYNYGAALLISACTFSDNAANFGGCSIYNYSGGIYDSTVQIGDTILNAGTTCGNIYSDFGGVFGGGDLWRL